MKYIHYCWFGNKPLPKLAQKCIKSWKKYLPDYEIIKWSEENVNINECPFIKGAYENKKWAFVADYARTKALKEYGGIYFDTDMQVLKNIDNLLENDTFLGVEDTDYVAAGVWYEKNKNALLPTMLLEKYKSMKSFDVKNIGDYSIPRLITEILQNFGFKPKKNEIQVLNNKIYLYPRDYFYPYSYSWQDNIFTKNTCMIHYYDASWISFKDKIEINLVRKIGKERTFMILKFYRKTKHYVRKLLKLVLYPLLLIKRSLDKRKLITSDYLNMLSKSIEKIKEYNNKDYIAIHNGSWFGVTSATKELFQNTVDCRELYRMKDIKLIGKEIIANNINQVIFSSMSIGDKELAVYLKKHNPNIKIKTFWHGSHSQVLDSYGWERNIEIIKLHKKGVIDVMATCKKSLLNFYNSENYRCLFLTNKVTTNVKSKKKSNNNEIVIGLYAAKCDDWRKNMYTQMAAVSLIKNAIIDMVPLNEEAIKFAKFLNLEIRGENSPLEREELLKRMSLNTINLYITYSECAPMLPLESFQMGVPCICGNNNHYFKNSELEKFITIDDEENPVEIKEKIDYCIKNINKVNKLYKEFELKNLEEAKKNVELFLKM